MSHAMRNCLYIVCALTKNVPLPMKLLVRLRWLFNDKIWARKLRLIHGWIGVCCTLLGTLQPFPYQTVRGNASYLFTGFFVVVAVVEQLSVYKTYIM